LLRTALPGENLTGLFILNMLSVMTHTSNEV
jgi:hypothetical protein